MEWAAEKPSLQDTLDFIDTSDKELTRGETLDFLIKKPDNTIIGTVGFHSIDWSVPRLEVGYWLDENHRRQGYV